MPKYDFSPSPSSSSSDDDDDALLQDIAALSSAFNPSLSPTSSEENNNYPNADEEEEDDDDDDDLMLLRDLKAKYGKSTTNNNNGNGGVIEPLNLKPLVTLPPIVNYSDDDDDDDNDFETLRAIQKRFSQFEQDSNFASTSRAGATGAAHAGEGSIQQSNCYFDKLDDPMCTNLKNASPDVSRHDAEQDPCDSADGGEGPISTSSFPKVALTFIEAIKKNRSSQKFIRSKLVHVEARMEEIKELQKRLKTLRDFQVQCKKKIGRALSQKQDARTQLFSVPKYRVKSHEKIISPVCYGPLENSHVASYRSALTKFPLSFRREKWSGKDRQNLEKGIIQQFQDTLLPKSADDLSALGIHGCVSDLDGVISSIRNIEVTPAMIQGFLGNVNWEQVASMYLPRRSGAECEARWLNCENRLINRLGWTKEEDKQLLLLTQLHGLNNWSFIAKELRTNRTPFQCLARYQRSLNASILKSEWTKEEDAQLRSAVESFGEKNWQAVASTLEGRTGTQCSNRWNKTLLPSRLRVGKWSIEEDKRLRVAVTLFDHKNWKKIAQFVPGRTQVQCRERWVNNLDPSVNQSKWTEEEDSKLKAATERYQSSLEYRWSEIAACVPSRTDNQCWRRWKTLFPDEVLSLRAAKRIQKAALISNFVDRESERPALGPNDFVALPPLETEGVTKTKKSRKKGQSHSTGEVALSSTSKKVPSRKSRRSLKLPDTEMISGYGETAESVGDVIVKSKKMSTCNSISNIQKRNRRAKVATKTKNISSSISQEVQSKKRRKRTKPGETEAIVDWDDTANDYRNNNKKTCKRLARKSGQKKKKAEGSCMSAMEPEGKSRRKDPEDSVNNWDVPLKVYSRRPKGVAAKRDPLVTVCTLLTSPERYDTIADATMSCSEENHDPAVLHDPLLCADSQSKMDVDKDVEMSNVDDLVSEPISFKVQTEAALGGKRKRKKSKKQEKLGMGCQNQSGAWEDVPLAVLFNGGLFRKRK